MKYDKPTQQQVSERLADVVKTHLTCIWQRPLAAHSFAAFAATRTKVEASTRPLILDSCCGTGDSTRYLAARFPESLVIGVDKSAHRLARHRRLDSTNYLILRADVNDFWRLAAAAGWQLKRHYLLYPNPYPKVSGLRKRWHGSPAFPTLLQLGGLLTLRTNWSVYAQEFACALSVVGRTASSQRVYDETPISAFETKYRERGDALFEVICDLQHQGESGQDLS